MPRRKGYWIEILLEEVGTEGLSAQVGLLVLPLLDFGEVAREQHIGDLPAIKLRRACVDRWGKEVILEAVGECRGFVANSSWDDAHHRVGDDARSELATRKHLVADRYLASDEVLTYAVVDTLIVAAEDDDILHQRQTVGLTLVILYAIG